jgi:serine/threonine protein kinase
VSELHIGKNKCVFRAIRQRDNLAVVLKVITQKTPEVVASMETEYVLFNLVLVSFFLFLFRFRVHSRSRSRSHSNLHSSLPRYQLLQKLKSSSITADVLELLPTGAIVMEDTGGNSSFLFLLPPSPLQPFILLLGVTGDRLIASSPEGFYCDIDSFLHLGVELARAINILHSHRIVHNDIKTRNFLFHGDRVQLLDFDLARRFNDLSSRSDRPQGTLHYLSPEQTGRLGSRPDYRTDLYSLGVVLFQYATGRYPFEQLAGVMELIHATISQPTPSVRQFAPHIPEPIAAIIGRLLQKSPDQRYQSAFGVLRDLQHCLEEFRHIGTILTFPLGQYDRPIVYRIPRLLYGREEELEVIQEVYESVLSTGTKRVLLMAGRAGVGKSSLLGPLKQLIQQKKGLFIGGKYEANTKHVPFKAFAQAFRQLIHSLMALPESEIEEHKTSLLAALGADGQVLLDVIPDLEKIIGVQSPITEMSPVENQNRFVSLLLRFVTKFATRGKPLVLFLDDLHWADSPSLKLFQSIMSKS